MNRDPRQRRTSDSAHGTVLVVDDEEADRLRLAAILERVGCHVLQAETGQTAAQLALAHQIDVLVTDIVMPDIGGIGLIRWLRHLQPEVTVVAVSGKGPKGLDAAKTLGASCVLTKPVEPDALVRAVRTAIRVSWRRRS